MPLINISSPHITYNTHTARIMRSVTLATLPALVVHCYFFGWGTLINLLLAITTALATEALILKIRQLKIKQHLYDFSAITTAVLLALSLPPFAPWWLIVLGSMIAIILGKHIYGGLGQNPFNPAMLAYAMLLVARPIEMSNWASANMHPQLSIGQVILYKFNFLSTNLVDAYTMATPLDLFKHPSLAQLNNLSVATLSYNLLAWQSLAIAYLAGGVWMLYKKIISWHIPLAVLASLAILAASFHTINPAVYAGLSLHLLAGSAIFCAFFIATDPVSAPVTNKGRLIFGVLIGALIFCIRSFGSSYPDAIAFAILLANFTVATIDHLTHPRTYGHKK
jgi:Na+-translocating ferredoxin:NAD+ oxidoreductase subunit D